MIDESYFKSSFDRVFGDFDMDQYDVRQKRRNKKAIDRDFTGPKQQIQEEAQMLFPEVEGLSEEEEAELQKYESRLRDLETVQAPRAGSRRIAGNPYSINSRGLLQGATNLATSAINEEREDRIYGDEQKADRASRGAQVIGKLGEWLGSDAMKQVRENSRDRRAERYSGFADDAEELRNKEAAKQKQSQKRQQYVEDQLPKRVQEMNEFERSMWELNRKQQHDEAMQDDKQAADMEQTKYKEGAKTDRLEDVKIPYWKERDSKDRQNALKKIQKEYELSGDDGVSATVLNTMAGIPVETVKSLNNQIDLLDSQAQGSGPNATKAEKESKRLKGYKAALDDITIDIVTQKDITPEIQQRLNRVNRARQKGEPLEGYTVGSDDGGGNDGGNSGSSGNSGQNIDITEIGLTETDVSDYAEIKGISKGKARKELYEQAKNEQ